MCKNYAKTVVTKITGEKKKEHYVLPRKVETLFLQTAAESPYYPLYLLALETGLRVGELGALRKSDIDLHNKVLHVKHTLVVRYPKKKKATYSLETPKTEMSIRDIPLTKKAMHALLLQEGTFELFSKRKGGVADEFKDFIFISKGCKPITASSLFCTIRTIVRKMNNLYEMTVPEFSMHTFRHTFATRCLEAGIQPKVLQKLLGHSKLEVTMNTYCHVTEESLLEEIHKLEDSKEKWCSSGVVAQTEDTNSA